MGQKLTAESVLARSKVDFKDRIVIVTGSSAGIGMETARVFAKGGARVIMACRGKPKADKAAEVIRNSIKNVKTAGTVEFMELDLMDLDNVRSFVKNFLALNIPLHYLINNAGIWHPPYQKTKQGFESTFQTNHLGHFLLTNLLMEKLQESVPARVIHVASFKHENAEMHWDGFLNEEKGYDGDRSYTQSKMANILFSIELDRKFAEIAKSSDAKHRVTSHAINPGVVATDVVRDGKAIIFLMKLSRPFLKTPGQGAATVLHCAVTPELETTGGKYYTDCKEAKIVPHKSCQPLDKSAIRLWEASEKLVGLVKEEKEEKELKQASQEEEGKQENNNDQEKEKLLPEKDKEKVEPENQENEVGSRDLGERETEKEKETPESS